MPNSQVATALHSAGSLNVSCPPPAQLAAPCQHIEVIAPDTLKTRSRIGVLVRMGADPDEIAEARVIHANALRERRIIELLAAEPPLTDGSRRRLAALIESD